jgi:hypothetical protein
MSRGGNNASDGQGTRSTVVIPANEDSVEVPTPAPVDAADAPGSSRALILQPDPNGVYIPEGPLAASISAIQAGGISPMFMQAPSGLVGWWKAEGNANDSSGFSHDGAAQGGATCVEGWIGQTFTFDGLNDFIQVNDDPALRMPSALTIEFWLKRQRLIGAYEYLIEKGGNWNSGNQNYALQIHGPDNGLCLTWNRAYRIAGVINDLNWHHCAVTATNLDADPVLYIDGWPQTISQSYGGAVNLNAASNGPLLIGAQVDGLDTYFSQTMIDEMSLYNQALSQSQIQSIFNVGRAGKTTTTAVCTPAPSGMVSWWRAETDAKDSYGANHGSFGGSYMGGQVGQTFRVVDPASKVTIPASPSLNVGTGNGFTIEGWINVYDDDIGGHPVFEWAGANSGEYGAQIWVNYLYLDSLFVNIFDTDGNSNYYWVRSAGIQSKTFQHLALSYDHTTGYAEVFLNGVSIDRQYKGVFTPQTTRPLYLGYRPVNLGERSFNGVIDEVSLYSRALSQSEVQTIYNAQSAGKCIGSQPCPPTISVQPQSQTVAGGGAVTFSVTASGVSSLHYQWFHNGAQIAAGTASSLTLSAAHAADAGEYKVVVFNLEGAVTSDAATLIVQEVTVPAFSPTGGSYPSSRNVIVTCSTSGATIHYSTTGLDPTQSDPTIASGSGILVDHNLTLKARAWKSAWTTSDTQSEAYRIEASPPTSHQV